MAISEICKFEVKKEIDNCTAGGMSRNQAAEWLAKVFSETLGRPISKETIRTKDKRARKEIGSNEPTKSKTPDITTNSTPNIIKNKKPQGGGKRKNAGRPKTKTDKEKIVTQEFKNAFEIFFTDIKKTKYEKFKNTSKQAALLYVRILNDVIIYK